jgi:hypothetical protein
MCCHFTQPFLPLSHRDWLIMCCHFTLYFSIFLTESGDKVLSLYPTIPPSHGEWLIMCCHFTLPFLPLSHGEWLMCCHVTLPFLPLSRRVADNVVSLYPTIPPSFSRRVADNVLSLYPTIPPSFSRSVADNCRSAPTTHRGHYILYLPLCGPLCAFSPSLESLDK